MIEFNLVVVPLNGWDLFFHHVGVIATVGVLIFILAYVLVKVVVALDQLTEN
jgi:hypothetical protein